MCHKKKGTACSSSARDLAPNEVGFFAHVTDWTSHAKDYYTDMVLKTHSPEAIKFPWFFLKLYLLATKVIVPHSVLPENSAEFSSSEGKRVTESWEPVETPFSNNPGYLVSLQLWWKGEIRSAYASVRAHTLPHWSRERTANITQPPRHCAYLL